jgi:vitamin B12 transporter
MHSFQLCSRAAIAPPAFALLLPAGASAQATPTELPHAVITPARIEQSIDDALPATTVITRADIERWQLSDFVSALGRQAGIEFAQTGGQGGAASLFVRGANSSQVLVLVDGIRLNAAAAGAASVGGIALDTIDRIEITRGNLSSLYGSAAVGGVVQIFTRSGQQPGATFSIEAGSGRSLNGAAGAGFDVGGARIGGSLAYRGGEQISAIDAARVVTGPFAPGANSDLDGNRNASASLGGSYRTAAGTLVAANAWMSRNDTDFDSTSDGPTATHDERSTLTAWNALVRSLLTETWQSQLQLGSARDRSRNESSNPFSFNNGEFESDNQQASWSNEVRVSEGVKAQLGVEYLQQTGASTAFDPSFSNVLTEFERSVGSAWFGVNGSGGPQQVQLNVRHDRYSDVGSATTGLISYGYRMTSEWRAVAQISNAFRAPSFSDLYYPFFGNAALTPEKSRSAELGLHYAVGVTSMRAALYRTDTRDLIVFDPASMQAQNIQRARVTGGELTAATRWEAWHLGANLSVLRAIDEATDERLLRRAPYVLNASLAYDPGAWRAGLEVSHAGPRDDLDINTFERIELDAYTLLRAVAAWRISPAVTLRFRIENLSDEKYETVSGYNVPPRSAFVGVDLALK